MISVGIVGFGKMGRIRADVSETTGRAQVVRVFEPHPSGPIEYPLADSAEAVVNDPEVDAVFVCTPNHLNKRITVDALNAGKHVFCEKPPAFTAGDVEEIREAEARSGKVLMYGFNHRHHTSIKHMKALISSGE